MNLFRNHIFFRIICFAFALQIFNISMDSRDFQAGFIPEDLTVNDNESVLEFILEDIMDIDNAIAEHDESDGQEGSNQINKTELFFKQVAIESNVNQPIISEHNFSEEPDSFYSSQYINILLQPPEEV